MEKLCTATAFSILDTKLYLSVVTLPSKDNVKLLKQLNYGFKRSVFWNKYSHVLKHPPDNINPIRIKLAAAFQGVHRSYVHAFNNVADNNNQISGKGHRKYFLPIVEINKLKRFS